MADKDSNGVELILMAILRLLAVQTVEGKSLTESVQVLERAGLERNLIANICDTSASSVRGLLSHAKRRKQSKKSTREAENAE